MEITCHRCHQAVRPEDTYCPACGLPQLVYSTDDPQGPFQPEKWNEAVRDASSIDWKPALRAAALLAVPAGLLCSGLSPLGIFGLFWMSAAAAWAVGLYMRSQRPAWITIGAGARIGLVTGLLGAWTAACTTAVSLFAMRFLLHQGKTIDDFWQTVVSQGIDQRAATPGVDGQAVALVRNWMLSPEGRAGSALGSVIFLVVALLFFAVAGGAIGARMLGRARQPEV